MKKVLVAEDSPLSRQIIEAFLSNIEIDLHFAVDGDEAYAKAIEIYADSMSFSYGNPLKCLILLALMGKIVL